MVSASQPRPRVVFCGTPAFAVPCLIATSDVADVVGVVCQPDKPAGRGLELTEPPVKREARVRGWPVHQPTKMRDGSFAAWLREQRVDCAVVVAYGRILTADALSAPRLGCVNVHASLLPRHRGAAPIHWSILRGDDRTGVCLMQMDEGLDTGPVLSARETVINIDETSDQLAERLSALGATILREELPRFAAGELVATPQDPAGATLAPLLTKDMARIDWKRSAREIHDQVRGLRPWPGASTHIGARRLMVQRTTIADAPALIAGAPGEVVSVARDRMWIATGRGAIALLGVQLEGKKPVGVREYLAGHPVRVGTVLGE